MSRKVASKQVRVIPKQKPAPRKATAPVAPTEYKLSPEAKAQLVEINQQIVQAKLALADAVLSQNAQLANVQAGHQNLSKALDTIAGAFEIPLDGSQKWTVSEDLSTLKRTK